MPFTASRFVPNDLRTTLITITSYENKVPVGTLFNPNHEGERAFYSITELLLIIDKMMDEMELPKAATSTRNFTSAAAPPPVSRLKKPTASIATFQLKVLFRQNASWQGTLTWVEGESEASFRSVFELICLMNSALAGGTPDT